MQGLALSAAGTAIGIASPYVLTRALKHLLFEVSARTRLYLPALPLCFYLPHCCRVTSRPNGRLRSIQ
jgi:hypothetical protein